MNSLYSDKDSRQINSSSPPAYPGSVLSDTATSTQQSTLADRRDTDDIVTARPQPSYASLLLGKTDRIRMIDFPGSVIALINETIKKYWKLGIQRQGACDKDSWEWKLAGRPWSGREGEIIPARRPVAQILYILMEYGWHLIICSDLSKQGFDKDTLFFRTGPPARRFVFPIAFDNSNKICVIDPPHEGVRKAIDATVRKTWSSGIHDIQAKETGVWQIKVKGNPWWSTDSKDISNARKLVCALLSTMDFQGYDLLASVDMTSGQGDLESRLDTWYFVAKN